MLYQHKKYISYIQILCTQRNIPDFFSNIKIPHNFNGHKLFSFDVDELTKKEYRSIRKSLYQDKWY